MYKICIDPGHGGTDPGAVNGAAREKDIVLDVGLKLKVLLEKAGYTVVMTREHDVFDTPGEKAKIANNENADLFLSVHCNSYELNTANGTETWYYTGAEDAKKFAECLQGSMVKWLKRNNRGVKSTKKFTVLNSTKMTAALAEIAFVSNEEEKALLENSGFRSRAAYALFEGIQEYLGVDGTNTEGSVKSQAELKIEAVQKDYRFSDKTMKYLLDYEFGEELIDRLYEKI